jgi:hypothetical protein
MTLPATSALLEQQKKDYNTVVTVCVQLPGCIGITLWAYSDYYSWIPSVFPGQVSEWLDGVHGYAFSRILYRGMLFRGTPNWSPSRLSTESQMLLITLWTDIN